MRRDEAVAIRMDLLRLNLVCSAQIDLKDSEQGFDVVIQGDYKLNQIRLFAIANDLELQLDKEKGTCRIHNPDY